MVSAAGRAQVPGCSVGARAWSSTVRRARPMANAAAAGPWMILAPHPDDEALGAGPLLASLAWAGERPHLAFVTDGSASHSAWGERRLAGARRREGERAARALGLTRLALWLGWRDARPPEPGSREWRQTVRRLGAHLRRHRVRQVVTSWGGEGHCDHEGAARLADAAARAARRPVTVRSVAVWGWTEPDLLARTCRTRACTVRVASGGPAAHRALLQHRSQLGTRIPDGFRLPRAMWGLTRRSPLVLFHGSGA